MGSLWSRPEAVSQHPPTLLLEPTTAHITAYQSISAKTGGDVWIYQSRLNILSITSGRQVSIYRDAADAFRPDPMSTGVVEGKLGNINYYNNDWVAFQINGVATNTRMLLCIPCNVTKPTLYARIIYHLTDLWRPKHAERTLFLSMLPLPSRADQSQQSTLSFYHGNEVEGEEWGDGWSETVNVAEFDPTQPIENSRPSSPLMPDMAV